MLSFETKEEDKQYIEKIAQRANLIATEFGVKYNVLDALMDIMVVHKTYHLQLNELLNASDPEFLHEVLGIRKNLNREAGILDNHFLPHFSVVTPK